MPCETELQAVQDVPEVQRTIGDGHDLASARFAGEPTLEACFDDEARLTTGASGPAVTKVQQALIDLGYDLGPAGVDGRYGKCTWNAVKQFKSAERLGWQHMGDVGPGTMGRLDALLPGGGAGAGLSEEDVDHPGIDPSAQAALIRMSRRQDDHRDAAYGLLEAVRGRRQDGIVGELHATSTTAPTLEVHWAALPAAWQSAVLVRDTSHPEGRLTSVFREHLRLDEAGLDNALLHVWTMFSGEAPMPPCSIDPLIIARPALDREPPALQGEGTSPIACQGGKKTGGFGKGKPCKSTRNAEYFVYLGTGSGSEQNLQDQTAFLSKFFPKFNIQWNESFRAHLDPNVVGKNQFGARNGFLDSASEFCRFVRNAVAMHPPRAGAVPVIKAPMDIKVTGCPGEACNKQIHADCDRALTDVGEPSDVVLDIVVVLPNTDHMSNTTFAHELGHALGLPATHPSEFGNLMDVTGDGSQRDFLNQSQLDVVCKSASLPRPPTP